MTDISPEEMRRLRRGGGLRDRLRQDMAAARAVPRGPAPEQGVPTAPPRAASRAGAPPTVCPWCRAQPGTRCTSPRGRVLADPHPSRPTTPEASRAQ